MFEIRFRKNNQNDQTNIRPLKTMEFYIAFFLKPSYSQSRK